MLQVRCRAIALLVALLASPSLVVGQPATTPGAGSTVRQELAVRLAPATHEIEVTAKLTLAGPGQPQEFLLHRALEITSAAPAVEKVPLGDVTPFFGNNGASGDLRERVARYRVREPLGSDTLTLTYRGRFDFPLSAQKEEYARGFRETQGRVAPEGVYLAGASVWYPHVSQELVTFSMTVAAPDGWHVISQGDGTSRDASGIARWQTTAPMDEIYLVGGPLRRWRDQAGAVETLVYLHENDPGLAGKYLSATAQYLEMYRALIGPYPYSKFALVENFWETGYGMPSFTLLGPTVVRFPFILSSSYPHEILHNWWGNSVFVDYATGNWCEGLTAYLADHLLQEQRGRGADHRRAALQKYASYVKAGRDFPLTEFRSRDSAATEAVGYGRMLMGAHMLRQELGDEKFRTFLARFYREYKGRRASFDDFRTVAEAVGGRPLSRFFDDLIARAGAPVLAVGAADVIRAGDEYLVRGTIRQTQPDAPFAFDVPVVVQTQGAPIRTMARFSGREATFEVRAATPPLALHVDPTFEVFRTLDPREIPPSIGQIFGEPGVLAVLPATAPAAVQRAWRELVEGWRTGQHQIEVVSDADVRDLPPDRAVWLLGQENRLAPAVVAGLRGVSVEGGTLTLDGERLSLATQSAVVVRRHPADPGKAIGWIASGLPKALPGLGRKLPHYGRYSYLGFDGEEPTNTVKGEWPTSDSPLSSDLRPAGERATRMPALTFPASKALIELPPVFSEKALSEHVAWLAAPEREGRGIGTPGLAQAADYVAAQFKAAGLAPGGENGGWFQAVPIAQGPDGRPAQGVNVIGVIPGANAAWNGQVALVTAHYDHLGRGWPEAHREHAGALHLGADDNASGVAVLLELARVFASGDRPPRTLVFVAFTGEEAGLLGARHYVAHPLPLPLDKVMGVINLDTVGRAGSGKISILGAGTATEWPHIFRGAGFVTGIDSTSVPGNYEASDQKVFIERGIPAVQIFTGPHGDYHRPGDTADKVEGAGLVKVATLVREAVAYLAQRPTPMTATIASPAASASAAASSTAAPAGQEGGRRVSFGAVPDFAFEGKGVKLGGVTPESPAAKAGLAAGDVITAMNGAPVASLQEFSTLLRSLQPGQDVTVRYLRSGEERSAIVTVVAR
jgi:hypothetical protein